MSEIPETLPGAPPFSAELRARLADALSSRSGGEPPRTRNRREDGSPLYTNRLLLETSPYLRQHAHNPVNWYPWSDEAFEEAARLDRPVLLSIGYSTCHWCHVMEEESFEDLEIARVMNELYIPVKVDREVRPDVDAIYMQAVQMLSDGRGGWPLNVWLTPDRKPFFGGTYFPPRDGDRGARTGFLTLLGQLRQVYDDQPGRVTEVATRLVGALQAGLGGNASSAGDLPEASTLRRAVARHAHHVLLIGRDAAVIAAAIGEAAPVEHCRSLSEAVARAASLARPGDAVLLAPACASFDMFRDFTARGDAFREAVGSLQ